MESDKQELENKVKELEEKVKILEQRKPSKLVSMLLRRKEAVICFIAGFSLGIIFGVIGIICIACAITSGKRGKNE